MGIFGNNYPPQSAASVLPLPPFTLSPGDVQPPTIDPSQLQSKPWINMGDDPGAQTGNGSGLFGGARGAFGLGPLSGSQKTALLFAGLRDAVTGFTNRPTDDLAMQRQQIGQSTRLTRQQAALTAFSNAKTPQERQAAMLALWGAGGDTTGLASAMKVGQPQLRDIPEGGSVAIIDPMTGLPTSTIQGRQKPPASRTIQIGGNNVSQQYNATTGNWDTVGTGPKFRPLAPKAAAPGAINIPHPSSMY